MKELKDLFAGPVFCPGVIARLVLPDISSLPLDKVAECADAVLPLRDSGLFQYGNSDGR